MNVNDRMYYEFMLQGTKSDCGCGCNDCGGSKLSLSSRFSARRLNGVVGDLVGDVNANVNIAVDTKSAVILGVAIAGSIMIGFTASKFL